MINAPKELWHSCLVVIDEAHIFAPEKGQSEAMEAVIDLATRGRKRGYCAVLATQRLSKLHKDAAAECNNKLVGRTGLDIDMKRASEELGFTSKEQYLSLRHLNPGEFYAYGPAISKEVIKIKVGEIKTSHPKAGSRIITKTIPPTEKIKAVLKKLTDLPQEAAKEANTIADLKIENANLKRENSVLKKIPPQEKVKPIEVSVIKDNQIARLEKVFASMVKEAEKHGKAMSLLWGNFNEVGDSLLKALDAVKTKPLFNNPQRYYPNQVINKVVSQKVIKSEEELDDIKIGRCERSIMVVLAQRQGSESNKSQLGILSGYSSKSGGFNNALGKLRSLGWINGYGENIQITDDGIRNVGPYEPLPRGNELREYWIKKLPKAESTTLRTLIDNYPSQLVKDQIGEITGYSSTSGGFNNALGKLRTLELISGYKEIKASDNLFN